MFRGVPLLVLLLFIYYFLAEFGLDIPALVAAVGGLALSTGAYQSEILRGAFNALPRGQAEAAAALGFPGVEIWRRILLPQALRISVPPLINEFILILKASSLVSVVGIAELTRVSMNIASLTYRPLEAYVGGGLFYLAINLCLAGFGAIAERRLAAGGGAMNPDVLLRYAPSLLSGFGVTGDVLERRRRARAAPRLRRRPALSPAVRAVALAAARLDRSVPRHAVSGATVPALRRRPLYRAQAQRHRRPASSASGSTPRPISPRSSAAASPPCRSARSRRR